MKTPPLLGLHHVTAVTGDAPRNVEFYTRILGLRLVKKTVNQDDLSAYHLFYGDELGRPGTELTFFDWPAAGPAIAGAGSVSEVALRVPGDVEALAWWQEWFDKHGVEHKRIVVGPAVNSLAFTDPEGQCLRLVAEGRGKPAAPPWRGSPAPPQAAITGLGAVALRVHRPEGTVRVLTEVLGFRRVEDDSALRFTVGEGEAAAQVLIEVVPRTTFGGRPGIGGIHHVAFRVADAAAQRAWHERLIRAGLANSGIIDRFYFQSLYFREPGGILFELATDEPGFAADEDPAHLGERLSLPPFLEPQRARIEAGLKPL